MKRAAYAVLFAAIALHPPVYGDGLPTEPQLLTPPKIMNQPVTFNGRDSATDDYLVALARAGDINILADVTAVSTSRPDAVVELPIGQEKPMLADFVFYDLVKQRKLTLVFSDERTALFWPTPDRAQIAQQILAWMAATPRNEPAPLDTEQTNALLKDYFQNTHKWDGKWENVDISVPVADLPPELRARVEAEIYNSEISRTVYGAAGPGASRAGSEYWKKTRLIVAPRSWQPGKPLSPFITTPGARVRGGVTLGVPIGRLDFLARR